MGGGWKIYFDCRDIGTGDASTEWHMTHRWVKFVFNSNRKNKLSISESKLTAKHEFGHFVTCRLERLAVYRFTTEDEIREEMEAIARVFEKIA